MPLAVRRIGDRTEVRGAVAADLDARYLVRPEEDALLTVRLVGEDPSRDIDLDLRIGEAGDESPAVVSQRGGSTLEEVRAAVAAGRQVVVRAYAYGRDDAGPFRLEASLDPIEEGWGPVPADAPLLPLDGEARGEVTRSLPEAWHMIHVEGVGVLVVSLIADAREEDIDLEIRTADGRIVAVSDAPGGVEEAVADATRHYRFFARVHAFEEGVETPYTIRARLDPDRVPPRPLPAAIRQIPLGEVIEGEITAVPREEWYRVGVTGEGTLIVEMEGEGEHDLDLEVFTERGELVGRSDALGPNETLEIDVPGPQDLVIRVYAYGDEDAGPYRLRTRLGPGQGAPPGAGPAGAETLPLGETVTGRISAAGASAWYRLDLVRPATLRVVLRGARDDVDLDLEIHDADRNIIAASEGDRSDEEVEVEAPAGRVFLRVFPYVPGAASDFEIRADTVRSAVDHP